MAKVNPGGTIWGLKFVFRFMAIGLFLTEIEQILYLTLKIECQGHSGN